MSYKIYDGLCIKTTDFQKVFALLQAFNEKAKEIGRRLHSTTAYKLAIHKFDKATIGGTIDEQKYGFVSEAIVEMMNEQAEIKRTNIRNSFVDFECKISVFPLVDRFLFYVNTEQDEYLEAFKAMEGVEEFAYWNNTDRPERCTEEEWNARKEVWDTAFGLMGDSNFNGLIFEVTSTLVYAEEEFFSSDLIPFDKRVKSIAEERLVSEKYDDEGKPSQIFSILRDNKDRLAEISEEVAAKLKKEITLDDLKNKGE